jgi:hypothetical protein
VVVLSEASVVLSEARVVILSEAKDLCIFLPRADNGSFRSLRMTH